MAKEGSESYIRAIRPWRKVVEVNGTALNWAASKNELELAEKLQDGRWMLRNKADDELDRGSPVNADYITIERRRGRIYELDNINLLKGSVGRYLSRLVPIFYPVSSNEKTSPGAYRKQAIAAADNLIRGYRHRS